MSSTLYFLAGLGIGAVAILWMKPAPESSCCKRVAFGARDRISGYAGPLEDVVSGLFDATGLTPHLPSVLDALGVPHDL